VADIRRVQPDLVEAEQRCSGHEHADRHDRSGAKLRQQDAVGHLGDDRQGSDERQECDPALHGAEPQGPL